MAGGRPQAGGDGFGKIWGRVSQLGRGTEQDDAGGGQGGMQGGGPAFSPRAAFWIVAVGVIGFFGLLYTLLLEDEPRRWTAFGPTSYSYSAIGHRAWFESLQETELSATRSRFASATVARAGLLVAAQPVTPGSELGALLGAERLLVVLPKWGGYPDPGNHTHVESVEPLDLELVDSILERVVGSDGDIRRLAGSAAWSDSALGVAPTVAQPQLMRGGGLQPLLATSDGWMLVGERTVDGRLLVVVSDPDIINNAGIGRGDNAGLIEAIVDRSLPGTAFGRVVLVFDETIHGMERAPNIVREALRPPFLIATLLAAAAALMLFWAAAGRFGKPLPVPRDLAFGKAGLVGNMATLLLSAGHHGVILRRYLRDTMRDVANAHHLPHGLREADLVKRLDAIAATRGTRVKLAALYAAIDRIDPPAATPAADGREARRQSAGPGPLLRAAIRLHAWKREMLYGSGRRPRPR